MIYKTAIDYSIEKSNQTIVDLLNKVKIYKEGGNIQKDREIEQLKEKNSQLESNNEQLTNKIHQLETTTQNLIDESNLTKEENQQLVSRLEKENQKLRDFLMALKMNPTEIIFFDHEEYSEGSLIGEGATSCVKVVVKEKKYAKKELKDITFDAARGLLRESDILFRIHHPCIIDIIAMNYGDEDHAPSLILSLEEMSLESAIMKGLLDERNKCIITVQIVLGMRYVHLRGFMHRDLKPSNILLNKELQARISDFGLAREFNLDTIQSIGVGTLRFMAPELLTEDQGDEDKKVKYTNKVDVYSFGITLIFIITGNYPKLNLINVASGVFPHLPNDVPNWVNEMISHCLSVSAENRPSFAEIFEIMKTNNFDLFSDSKDKTLTKKQQQMKKDIEAIVLKIEAFEFQHQND